MITKKTFAVKVAAAVALAAACHGGNLSAREIAIANPAELKQLASALPGDVVILKNGVWTNARINVTKGGSAEAPLVIRAETPGGVTLNGSSILELNAPYVTVDGLFFHQGMVKAGAVMAFNSSHGIVRNTAIIDYNPPKFETNYYWVYFHGDNNLVERCYFKGKNNDYPLIGNHWDGSQHNSVTNCLIKDIPYAPKNGREIFRIWGPGRYDGRSDDGAFFTIEGNLLDHADGEGEEIISLKSNRNRVVRNTILATRGGITLRQGNFNTVQDNVILGKGVAGSAGIRMSGENHIIRGNFISGCEFGIRVSCGEYIEKDLTGKLILSLRARPTAPIPSYTSVKQLTLSDNVLIGIKDADLDMGARYKLRWPKSQNILLPEACQITNNRFVRPQGGVSVTGTVPGADHDPVLPKLAIQPSQYAGNVIVGGKNAFAPARSGFTVAKLPSGWSEAAEATKFKPLTPADVGPDWVRTRGL